MPSANSHQPTLVLRVRGDSSGRCPLADRGLLWLVWLAAATASDNLFAAACKYPNTTLPCGVGTSAVLWQAYGTHCRARIMG